jgi:hypothetical protein
MKHLKDFSIFESSVKLNEGSTPSDMIFDWLPYDSQTENPIQGSIPAQIKFDGIVSFLKENSSMISDISEAGLFIAHVPTQSGFDRFIITSLDPLLLDMAQFDKKFNKVQEYKGINPEELDLGKLTKGSKIVRRFGL